MSKIIRSHELRVRAKSLAAEISIIKMEERKVVKKARSLRDHLVSKGNVPSSFDFFSATSAQRSLRQHRIDVVCRHVRCTNLVRAFERNLPYKEIERVTYSTPDFKEIERLVLKYLPKSEHARWTGWLEEAQAHLKAGGLKVASSAPKAKRIRPSSGSGRAAATSRG